jgi:hypothetical protein
MLANIRVNLSPHNLAKVLNKGLKFIVTALHANRRDCNAWRDRVNLNWSTHSMWHGVKQLTQHDYTIWQVSERYGHDPALERLHSLISLLDLR